ncbi:MAG: GntR family transcriptional regulator [Deltaproteobacteria bacterium]|nr:GntR family transcriptional regulator [Deltaproteobacteria bacterium]
MDLLIREHLNLSDRIFEIIGKQIVSGAIKPGERLVETELAVSLGTSKSPVREALKKLEGEGIVKLIPRKGYFVRDIDRKSIEDFVDIMIVIEPAIARYALKQKNEDVCKEIDEILDEMTRTLKKKDYESYVVLNDRFHGLFVNLTENEWFLKFFNALHKQADMLRSLSLHSRDRFSRSIEEHTAIADAYKKGNEKQLLEAVRHHILMFKKNFFESDFLQEKL